MRGTSSFRSESGVRSVRRSLIRWGTVVAIPAILLCGCLVRIDNWKPNAVGIASQEDILRETVALEGDEAQAAQDRLANLIGFTFPDSTHRLSVEIVTIEWRSGGMSNEDVIIVQAEIPRADVSVFEDSTPCGNSLYSWWETYDGYQYGGLVFDTIGSLPSTGDQICLLPIPGAPPGPNQSMVVIVSNTDPANVLVAAYDGTPAH